MRLPPFNPHIATIIGVFSIASSAVLVKLAGDVPAGMMANYRFLLAVLIMAPIILKNYRHEFKRIQKRDWLFASVAGVFLAVHFIFWFESLHYTSVTSSVILVTLQPIFLFLGTFLFFKERFSFGTIASLVIALLGSAIILFGDFTSGGSAFTGDLLAIVAAMALAIYFLAGQQVTKRLSLITYTFIIYTVSAATLLIYNLVIQNAFTGYTGTQWWLFVAMAIIPTFFGHALLNFALKWLNAATISFSLVLEPIAATVLAVIILREQVTANQLLGGTIVIFGLLLFTVSITKKRVVTISSNIPKD